MVKSVCIYLSYCENTVNNYGGTKSNSGTAGLPL